MWLVLAATALVTGGFMAAYSYISPLLTERTGISEGAVPLVLVGFGVGALLGTNITGRLGDRKPLATFITTSVASVLVLLLLIPLSTSPVATVVLVVLLGVTGLGITSIATPPGDRPRLLARGHDLGHLPGRDRTGGGRRGHGRTGPDSPARPRRDARHPDRRASGVPARGGRGDLAQGSRPPRGDLTTGHHRVFPSNPTNSANYGRQ
ncbi:hypothetical protein ABIE67_005990 [Streptomyces sp. V4I8]